MKNTKFYSVTYIDNKNEFVTKTFTGILAFSLATEHIMEIMKKGFYNFQFVRYDVSENYARCITIRQFSLIK